MTKWFNLKWQYSFNVILVIIVAFVAIGSPVYAQRGPQGVEYGLHNLSVTGADPSSYKAGSIFPPPGTPADAGWAGSSPYKTNEDHICVFCHTPHGGVLTAPLWNRSNPENTSFTHYNSSSLSGVLQGLSTTRPISDESLACMACHDGSISVNHVLNAPNDRGGVPISTLGVAGPGAQDTKIVALPAFPGLGLSADTGVGARIGATPSNPAGTGDLTDDHPISFSYAAVLSEYNSGPRAGSLQSIAIAEGAGVRFFGGTTKRVECSSCHDPHVNYNPNYGRDGVPGDPSYAPFLITTNSGSHMCFACHNK